MTNLKIIFLDIDGVLCTRRSHLAYAGGGIWSHWDPTACALLKKVLDKHEAKLVISSTWRRKQHQQLLTDRLHEHGLYKYLLTGEMKGSHTPFDIVEDSGNPFRQKATRGREIDHFLKFHPHITDYRILDDDSDMLEYQKRFFIHTDGNEGMTAQNMRDLLDWRDFDPPAKKSVFADGPQ